MKVQVRPATKGRDSRAIRALGEHFGGRRVTPDGVSQVVSRMFRTRKKDPENTCLLVAEDGYQCVGVLFATRRPELDLFENSAHWVVHYLYGFHAARPLLTHLREYVCRPDESVLVVARDAARGATLSALYARLGFERVMTVWQSQGG